MIPKKTWLQLYDKRSKTGSVENKNKLKTVKGIKIEGYKELKGVFQV